MSYPEACLMGTAYILMAILIGGVIKRNLNRKNRL